jgi:HK97 family phage prohead protease
MTSILTRAFGQQAAIEGRRVEGVAVPWDQPTEVGDWDFVGTETFRRGAFTRTLAQRGRKVRFLLGHDHRGLPLGSFEAIEERVGGLYVRGLVADTAAGRDVLALATEGHDLGLSIGFQIPDGGARYVRADEREIVEARLFEVSVVGAPQYEGAGVTGVRARPAHPPFVATARRRLWLTLQEIS